MGWQLRKKHLLPLAAGLALSLSAVTVLAGEELELGHREAPTGGGSSPAPKEEDSKGLLRDVLWEGSFDKAGDASREAEKALKKQAEWKVTCSQAPAGSATAAQAQATAARCASLEKEIRSYGQEAASISNTQHIFSDVSKASDIAAVGAIGATAYAQLGKRNPSQASSLESVAKIQETAGYVSYATGAADFTMGAYAYAAHKEKFEEMEEKLRKANASKALLSKVSAAAEASKQAAYSHMMYGAGKAAFGYASMYLAKQNRKQAAALTSLTENTVVAAPAAAAAAPTISGGTGSGGSGLNYNNNQPVFSVSDGTSLSTATAANTSASPVFASGSASVMPGRGLASSGSGGGPGGGGGFSSGGSAGGATSGAGNNAAAEGAASEDATPVVAEKSGTYEINALGGSPHYGGGGSKSSSGDETAGAIGSLLSSALGGNGPASAGTGVNPNQLYREATTDEAGAESQGNEAGVSSGNRTLFEVMRSKYAKIIQGGRVMGPSAVEVRN